MAGGFCDPLPIAYASKKPVLAVNVLLPRGLPRRRRHTPFRNTAKLMIWAYSVMQSSLIESGREKADILIEPKTTPFNPFQFHRAAEIIDEGRKAALAALPKIRRLVHG